MIFTFSKTNHQYGTGHIGYQVNAFFKINIVNHTVVTMNITAESTPSAESLKKYNMELYFFSIPDTWVMLQIFSITPKFQPTIPLQYQSQYSANYNHKYILNLYSTIQIQKTYHSTAGFFSSKHGSVLNTSLTQVLTYRSNQVICQANNGMKT